MCLSLHVSIHITDNYSYDLIWCQSHVARWDVDCISEHLPGPAN